MIKYSAKNHACYDTALNYKSLPDDLVEITTEEHKTFMGENIPDGKRLIEAAYPFAFEDIPESTNEELVVIEKSWRDSELSTTDKYGLSDFPDSDFKTLMIVYRQELRDYPDKTGFPNCDRPSEPE